MSKRYVDMPGAIIAKEGQVFTQRHDNDRHWLEIKNPDGTIENYTTIDGLLVKMEVENANKRTERTGPSSPTGENKARHEGREGGLEVLPQSPRLF